MPSRAILDAIRDRRNREWLRQYDAGAPAAAIAEKAGVSRRTVQLGVSRARHEIAAEIEAEIAATISRPRRPWWLDLVPLFPLDSFTPQSKCSHHGPIRQGSVFCCMVCHRCGLDDHPALRLDPATDPAPDLKSEPEPAPPPALKPGPAKDQPTRRERRAAEAAARLKGVA